MTKTENSRQFDLEERTYKFASKCRDFVKRAPRSISNIEYEKQLIRSSGSVGANYIEANEALSRKDFVLRVKICRKEVKESIYWLKLLDIDNGSDGNRLALIKEATELMKIFGSIIEKSK